MVLYNAFVLSWGLTITQNSIHTISYLDRSHLSDTRSAENDWIGADTDPEYRIDASLDIIVYNIENLTFILQDNSNNKTMLCFQETRYSLCLSFITIT